MNHFSKTILTAVDIFCGCGGLTKGLKMAGFRVVSAVEINPMAVKTYKANHQGVLVWGTDIRKLQPDRVLKRIGRNPGEIDLLAGCPPCQGFSTLRTLNGSVGVEDPRNDLLLEFLRFVEGIQPRAVMVENVPGLEKDLSFKLFCERLESLGYIGDSAVLDAADYGVPQRRRRLIYLAGLGIGIPFAEKGKRTKNIRDVIFTLPVPGESGDRIHDMPERRSSKVKQIIRLIPKNGGSRKDLPDELQLDCHRRCNGFKDIYGRMTWNEVAPTITSGCTNPSKGRFLHPEEDRAITLREAALLQGFPVDYKFVPEIGKGVLAEMIGNALPPPFIAAHSKIVRRVLQNSAATRKNELISEHLSDM